MEALLGRSLRRFPRFIRNNYSMKPCWTSRCFSVSAQRFAVSAASVSLRAGVPSVTIRLPGSDESCVFSCPPLTHKVSDLTRDIKAQDSSIDSVAIRTTTGEIVAGATTVGILLKSDFVVHLDGASFPVSVPEDVRNCVEHLDDVRSLVSRLYSSLEVAEHDKAHQENLQKRLGEVEVELQPLTDAYQGLAVKARNRNRLVVWSGLGFMAAQFGFLARLTWWEYSWDIMEPVTYFVTYGTAIFCYAYFVLTREDYTYPVVADRNYLINLHKSFNKSKFPVEKYNELISEAATIRRALERMENPVSAPDRLRRDETSV